MLFEKMNLRSLRRKNFLNPVILMILVNVIIISFSSCTLTEGNILILEDPDGTGFAMRFNEWSSVNKCELYLNKGEEVKVEITRDAGKIALLINSKNGDVPYTGKNLESGMFTVTISEAGQYIFNVTGSGATGKIVVERIS